MSILNAILNVRSLNARFSFARGEHQVVYFGKYLFSDSAGWQISGTEQIFSLGFFHLDCFISNILVLGRAPHEKLLDITEIQSSS